MNIAHDDILCTLHHICIQSLWHMILKTKQKINKNVMQHIQLSVRRSVLPLKNINQMITYLYAMMPHRTFYKILYDFITFYKLKFYSSTTDLMIQTHMSSLMILLKCWNEIFTLRTWLMGLLLLIFFFFSLVTYFDDVTKCNYIQKFIYESCWHENVLHISI